MKDRNAFNRILFIKKKLHWQDKINHDSFGLNKNRKHINLSCQSSISLHANGFQLCEVLVFFYCKINRAWHFMLLI